ncbi:MAG: cupin domain-containing protein, partial [Magnetovibrio sp.]|nr:cupin domain-containing protein [Magnetovibrio sp.]
MSEAARSNLQHDNDRTRVTLWEFPPGAATGWHRHEMDYVIVPLVTGRLTLIEGDGVENTADQTAGGSYFREAGVEHDVINANAFDFAFLEVEFK